MYRLRYGSDLIIEDSIISRDVSLASHVRIISSKLVGPKIFVGEFSAIAEGSRVLNRHAVIRIGNRVSVGPNCLIQTYSHNANYRVTSFDAIRAEFGEATLVERIIATSADIVIEDDVWIGINAVIMPGVTVGRGSIIGANSVVTKNIGENEVWGGVPAKLIKQRDIAGL